jgi:hypothetical protein
MLRAQPDRTSIFGWCRERAGAKHEPGHCHPPYRDKCGSWPSGYNLT